MAAGRWKQARLMLWKNWLFSVRSWKSTSLQLLAPLFFLLLVTGLSYLPQGLENVPYPSTQRVGTLPHCKGWNGKDCLSLIVMAVNVEDITANVSSETRSCIEDIMQEFSHETHLGINTDIKMYLTFEQLAELFKLNISGDIPTFQDYFTQHPNQTQAAVVFFECTVNKSSPASSKLNYTILYNSTRALAFQQLVFGSPNKPDGRKEIAILLDSLFLSRVLEQPVQLSVSVASFPQFFQQESVADKQASSATTFLFCAITFQFVMMLYNIVSEKDLKLRQGLKLIGLKDSIYWGTWAITGLVIALLSTVVLMVTGYACQLKFFLNTEPDIIFLLFFIYSGSMVPLAFFTSVFLTTIRQAVNAGMLVFVVGLMVISLLSNPFLLIELYQYVEPLVIVLAFLPPFHLAKAMSDIGGAGSTTGVNGLPQQPHYFDWQEMERDRSAMMFDTSSGSNTTYIEVYLPPTYMSLVYLVCDALFYGILAWYLDAIIRGNHGIPRKLYFPLQPSYWLDWLPRYSHRTSATGRPTGQDRCGLQDNQDFTESSPLLGRQNTYGVNTEGTALDIQALSKAFYSGCLCVNKKVNMAVDELSLKVQQHQILALLGHNGAGKSTTINMLTGLLEPDRGNAYFYGLSVTEELDAIRNMLGVCPQHDLLWGDLTAWEHMQLFATLKDISREEMVSQISTLLEEVQLNHVADHRVKTFSGGMKRRLSVALSFLGDPTILFLDEPTTGMDPRIRRDIWNLILRKKQGRVTVMTTHSMEEADILGDSIAIMANGTLKVIGTSVSLKNTYAGYNIELVVRSENEMAMHQLVKDKLPGSRLRGVPLAVEGGVLLSYILNPDRQSKIVPFFTVVEEEGSVIDMILDYSISQTTLEEVFLNVTAGELFRDSTYQPILLRSLSNTVPLSPSSPSQKQPFSNEPLPQHSTD